MVRINDVIIKRFGQKFLAEFVGVEDKYRLFYYSPHYFSLEQAIADVTFKQNLVVRLNKRFASRYPRQLTLIL